jgi:hypothetical protein
MRALRRTLGFLTLIGVVAGVAVMLRRRLSEPEPRVDLYYADGSMVSLEAGKPDAERFFELGRDGLSTARSL